MVEVNMLQLHLSTPLSLPILDCMDEVGLVTWKNFLYCDSERFYGFVLPILSENRTTKRAITTKCVAGLFQFQFLAD